jgi:hypothetical protein
LAREEEVGGVMVMGGSEREGSTEEEVGARHRFNRDPSRRGWGPILPARAKRKRSRRLSRGGWRGRRGGSHWYDPEVTKVQVVNASDHNPPNEEDPHYQRGIARGGDDGGEDGGNGLVVITLDEKAFVFIEDGEFTGK